MSSEPEPGMPKSPVIRESTVDLHTTTRVACAVLGVGSAVFAAIVLWRGEGGAATVAFIVLGAVLILLAASGVIPRRIKSGDHEVEMLRRQVIEGAQESTDNALATMTRPEIEEFIEENLRSRNRDTANQQSLAAASRAQEALDFERQTLQNLRILSPDVDVFQPPNDVVSWDAELRSSDAGTIRVNLIWKLTSASVKRAIISSSRPSPEAFTCWIIAHSASQHDLAIASNLLASAVNQQAEIRVVVSNDTPPNLWAVMNWLTRGGPHPSSVAALTSF